MKLVYNTALFLVHNTEFRKTNLAELHLMQVGGFNLDSPNCAVFTNEQEAQAFQDHNIIRAGINQIIDNLDTSELSDLLAALNNPGSVEVDSSCP